MPALSSSAEDQTQTLRRRRGRPPKTEKKKRPRAALYARVSTEEQARRHLSVPAQIDFLQDWADQEGMDVVAVFKDEGISGGTIEDRPDFVRMRELAKNTAVFDVILVSHSDRFARDTEITLRLQREFREAGVRVRFHNFDDPLDDPSKFLAFTVQAAVDAYQRGDASKKTSYGMRKKIEKGYVVGQFLPTFFDIVEDTTMLTRHGRPSRRLVPRPELLEMSRLRAQGLSYAAIATRYDTNWQVVRGNLRRLEAISASLGRARTESAPS